MLPPVCDMLPMDVTFLREKAAHALRLARDTSDPVLQANLAVRASEFAAMADDSELSDTHVPGPDPK